MPSTDDARDRLDQVKEIQAQSTMDHWWPRLRDVNVPKPDTIRLDISEERTFQDGLDLPVPDEGELRDAMREVGGPPAFLRSDITSSKHEMEGGSYVESIEDPIANVAGVVQQHHLAMTMPMPASYYVREWLDLWHRYKSFAGGATPVAAELRVFLLDGDVYDWGFYWPMESIWEHSATADNWPELHAETKQKAEDGVPTVRDHANQAATEFSEGYWSVDFGLAEDGRWYALDMARGEMSWHPDGVEQAVADPRMRGPDDG